MYHDAGILGEEHLDEVGLHHAVEVDVHAPGGVGEVHLEQGGYEAAGADVVLGQEQAAFVECLESTESAGEGFGGFHGGSVMTHGAEALHEGRTAEFQLVAAEVYQY